MKILVTGFEPFGGDSINSSYEVLKELPDIIGNKYIYKQVLPVVGEKALEIIHKSILKYDVDVIISLGQNAKSDINIERVGINLADYRIEDNDGNKYEDIKIFEDGKDAYMVKLPVKSMLKSVEEKGLPVSISLSAGSYICNYVLYGTSYIIEKNFSNKVNGFIHLPLLPIQVIGTKKPSMNKKDLVEAVKTIINTI